MDYRTGGAKSRRQNTEDRRQEKRKSVAVVLGLIISDF
jgi:hypothetical protein